MTIDVDFWIARWAEGRIGFHEGRPNTFLTHHVARLGSHRRVLVPLCGKSEDLAIRRLNDDKSIPFMPPSPKLFQKGVYFCSAMPRILCRPLVDRA